MVKHKNDQVKAEAIFCLKEFRVKEAKETLKDIFSNCKTDIKIMILDFLAVLGEKKDYSSNQQKIATGEETGAIQKADLALTPLVVNNEIVINPIFFDFDKFNIRDEAAYELEKIVTVMQDNPEMIIKIESHTDSRGTKEYNRDLSDRRAKSTKEYLLTRNIAPERIESAIGYDETQLVNECANRVKCTEEQHQANRRSEFLITNIQELGIAMNPKKKEVTPQEKVTTHKVKRGETLFSIAKTYGLTVEQLKQLNNLTNNNIEIGQELIIK